MTAEILSPQTREHAPPYWTWAVGLTVVFLLVRLFAIRFSPLQLYADEAQYWLWSRQLDFGYFTKPPLIAWIIRLTTLGGDAEPLVRLSAPLLHAAAGLFLYRAALRLYDAPTALCSLLVYAVTPAVQLGSFVVSTDTPMTACLAAGVWAYVALQQAAGRERLVAAAALGLALGLAFLAKYAALYSIAGLILHLALSRPARRAWTLLAAALAVGVFAATIAPNIVWNLDHRLATVSNVASEAAWGARKGGPLAALSFLGSQFGVFGPLSFAVLLGGAIWLGAKRRLQSADALLLAWTLPPLAIVLVQALIAGAKANWAAAAFAPGSILVAAWMLRWRRPRILAGVMAAQALLGFGGLVIALSPQTGDKIGLSNALRSVRGERELTDVIVRQAQAEQLAGRLSAVAVDKRDLFNTVAYYGRDYFGVTGPPLKAWLHGPYPTNEAEYAAPLTAAFGARVLAVSKDSAYAPAMRPQFRTAGPSTLGDVWIDRTHQLHVEMFVGEGFMPPTPKH